MVVNLTQVVICTVRENFVLKLIQNHVGRKWQWALVYE